MNERRIDKFRGSKPDGRHCPTLLSFRSAACLGVIRNRYRHRPCRDAFHSRLGLTELEQRLRRVLMRSSENTRIRLALFEAAVVPRHRRDDNGGHHSSGHYDSHLPPARRHAPIGLSELLQPLVRRSDLCVACLLAPLT
jgi:hypothetical protein